MLIADLTDSSALLGDTPALRRRLAGDGYLFLRGLLPVDMVLDVRERFVDALRRVDWLAPGAIAEALVPSGRAVREAAEGYFAAYLEIQRLQAWHEIAHHPALVGLAEALYGEPVLVHPRKVARTSLPHDDEYTPPHQDYRLIQGSVDTLTAWLPIGDCPRSLGALRVLEASHAGGLAPVEPSHGPGGLRIDVTDDDPRWRTADYRAGDVILFTSLTVHGALRNDDDVLRLSADFRYQAASEPVVDLSLLPHYHPTIPDWAELTAGWTSLDSIAAPEGLHVTEMVSPIDPSLVPPPSRLSAA